MPPGGRRRPSPWSANAGLPSVSPSATSRAAYCSGVNTYSLISVSETNEYVGVSAGPSGAGHQPLVNAVDLERIGIEQP